MAAHTTGVRRVGHQGGSIIAMLLCGGSFTQDGGHPGALTKRYQPNPSRTSTAAASSLFTAEGVYPISRSGAAVWIPPGGAASTTGVGFGTGVGFATDARFAGFVVPVCDGTGLCIIHKRLDRGTFRVPTGSLDGASHLEIDDAAFEALFDGLPIAPEPAQTGATRGRVH